MNRSASKLLLVTAVVALSLSVPHHARAHWMMPQAIPVERIVKNLEAKTKENPKDTDAFYHLARAHYWAWHHKSSVVQVFEKQSEGGPELAPDFMQHYRFDPKQGDRKPSQAEIDEHLRKSLDAFLNACELKPADAAICLSFASFLEEAADSGTRAERLPSLSELAATSALKAKWNPVIDRLGGEKIVDRDDALKQIRANLADAIAVVFDRRADSSPLIAERVRVLVSDYWRDKAIDYYYKAFESHVMSDLSLSEMPLRGFDSLISVEAGKAFLRTAKARGLKEAEIARVKRVEEAIARIEEKPDSHTITPIVFSLEAAKPLRSLISTSLTTSFDLDGTSRGARWQWVEPTTAILVWDPTASGVITSGRELFGTVTWWMFWSNGYDALDALDDDRNGELAGSELKGLAVWTDRNSNGLSDPGEVTSLETLGVAALSARATTSDDGCPANPAGLKMSDGRVLPTYDWIAHPVENDHFSAMHDRTCTLPAAWSACMGVFLIASRRRRSALAIASNLVPVSPVRPVFPLPPSR